EKAKQLRTQEVEDKVIAEIRRQARQQEVKEKIAAIQARARQIKQEEVPRGPLAKDIILKKLTGSSLGEEAERGEFLARVAGQEKSFEVKDKEQTQEVVFRPVVRRPSFIEKFLAR
ncbi:MAG: hypothetical protein NTV62_03510, partial [Candidatus Gribaldobacteria bacterium]|nr:hypothetical protein [Candidatus Gribaldobacteria bacterium]